MAASFTAEMLKLRKRPATWVLATIFFVAVLVLGYVFVYGFLIALYNTDGPVAEGPVGNGGARAGASPGSAPDREEMMSNLLPESLPSSLVSGSSGLGGPLALILGALSVGSEYGWGTLKTVLTQRPGRSRVLWGKLSALGVTLVAFALAALAAGLVGSYGVALLEGLRSGLPPLGELAWATGALWLILMAWAVLGAFLAVLFRGSSLAVGLGLVYALVLENIVVGLPVRSETFDAARQMLLGRSSSSLATSFDPPAQGTFGAAATLDPGPATLVLVAYVVGLSVLATLVLCTRDVV